MANRILQKTNEIRLEAERKLQDAFNEDEKLMGLGISIEVRITNIPREEMPNGSKQIILENKDTAFSSFIVSDRIAFMSETYDLPVNAEDYMHENSLTNKID